jgi:putative protease
MQIMIKKRSDYQLLAPVGTFESLAAAAQARADGIYFGVEQLNMRAKSTNNFKITDLPEIVKRAHNSGMRAYLALNTVIYDHEINLMHDIVDKAKASGIDAIIATDQSVIHYVNSIGMPVHISTQLNVSNVETLKFYAKYADVMVLARELSLSQVKYITQKIEEENITGFSGEKIKIEIFIHGALCMAISGKCYMSLHEFNSSANRGACQQTCRRSYIVTDKETGYQLEIDNEYIMSPKDLATFFFFDKIMDSGATVFKIEGRARGPEYVKTTVEVYNDVINSVLDGTYSHEKIKKWEKELSKVYNRGFWDGYYLGRKLGEWSNIHGSKATRKKLYIGRVSNFFTKIGVVEVKVEAFDVKRGDTLMFIGPTSGVVEVKVEELRDFNENVVDSVAKGKVATFKVPEKLRRSDKVYKIIENK